MGLAYISECFISVESLPDGIYGLIQLLSLGAGYGYVLMYSSNLISDGSELLLLVPAIAGIVGSIVLPVLGAVPDGAIVLFSGMGPDAQEQLGVGVGALAGSTIMLLTLPWFMSIYGGRVPLDGNGRADYKHKKKLAMFTSTEDILYKTGINLSPNVNTGSYMVFGTSLAYFLIQGPGMYYLSVGTEAQVAGERPWAILGATVCISCFLLYLYKMYQLSFSANPDSTQNLKLDEAIKNAIAAGQITLLGVFFSELMFVESEPAESSILMSGAQAVAGRAYFPPDALARLERILKPFFHVYDIDGNGELDIEELYVVFKDLGVILPYKQFEKIFEAFDVDNSGSIDFEEFVKGTADWICTNHTILSQPLEQFQLSDHEAVDETGDDESESEEMPLDIQHLSPEEQQRKVLERAAFMMFMGTVLVVVFADPMVDVLNELGTRTGIPAFYVSFLLAPLISNSSEIVASYNLSLKKTNNTISVALSTLQGAAIMNNTCVLGIFMFLIAFQGLSWEFLAETLAIFLVQLLVSLLGLQTSQSVYTGCIILSLYPASLVLVFVLESMGYD